MKNSGSPILQVLLLLSLSSFGFGFGFPFGYSLGFCSANFRKERPGFGWNRHFAQQQGSSCDLASVYRVPGIIVLADRCTFQREPSEQALGGERGFHSQQGSSCC